LAQLGDDLREGNPSWSGGAMTSPTPRMRVRPDDLHPRPVGGRPAALPASPPEHEKMALAGARREFAEERRLPDAGLADHHEDAAQAGNRSLQAAAQGIELALPADEDAAGEPGRRDLVARIRLGCGGTHRGVEGAL